MAWSSPTASYFATNEIVLAAKMNVLSDDLRYLKGLDGAIALDNRAGITVAANNTTGDLSLDGSYGSVNDYHQIGWASVSAMRGIASAGGEMSFDFILQSAGSGSIAAGRTVMRMRGGDGFVGIGTTAPQGKLHVDGTIGNWVCWEYDGVDGTARTVLATGNASYAQAGFAITRPSNGAIANVISLNATSLAGATLYSVASDQCLLTAASGGYTVARTSGSLTYKVVLLLMTL